MPAFDLAVNAIVDASRGWPLLPARRFDARHRRHRPDDERSVALRELLDGLCTDLGFCLPRRVTARLARSQPLHVDELVDATFRAAGMRSDHFPHLRQQVRHRLAGSFPSSQDHS